MKKEKNAAEAGVQVEERAKGPAEAVLEYFGSLRLGEAETHGNLTVFPVFTEAPQRNGYVLLDEAVKTGRFTVTEVTEGGSVQTLKVVNRLDKDVLILDGDILVGAKQNRSVTTTIIIGKGTEAVINVNCVEHGRWSYKSRSFGASDRPVYAKLRALKAKSVNYSLKNHRSFEADQGKVWDEIHQKSVKFSIAEPSFCRSGTDAADEMYGSFDGKTKEYESSFRPQEGQVGFVALVGGKVAGCDIFGNPGVLSRTFGKGLRSYILDAIEQSYDKEKKPAAGEPRRKAAAFLSGLKKTKAEAFPATGKGVSVRLEGGKTNGFAALDGDQVVHLAAFAG